MRNDEGILTLVACLFLVFLSGCAQTNAFTFVKVRLHTEEAEVVRDYLLKRKIRIGSMEEGVFEIYNSQETRATLRELLNILSNRITVIVGNVVNAKTTLSDHQTREPYRRKILIIDEKGQPKINEDTAEYPVVYDPSHPHAEENGYVKMPNVNVYAERVDLQLVAARE
jgi:hypothetical protein